MRRKNKYAYEDVNYEEYDGEDSEYLDLDYAKMADEPVMNDGPHNPPRKSNRNDPITDKVESLQEKNRKT